MSSGLKSTPSTRQVRSLAYYVAVGWAIGVLSLASGVLLGAAGFDGFVVNAPPDSAVKGESAIPG